MNIIITILLVIAALIAAILLLGLFIKKDYFIEREVIINKPKQEVFNFIRLLRNQDSFSKWANMDSAMKKDYSGTDGTVGFVSAWDSNQKNVGKGEQTIKKIIDGEKIYYDLHFMRPFESHANASMSVASLSENQTKVKWNFSSSMKYPSNLMLLFMNMEKMLGDDLETGLWNLKQELDK